MSWCNLRQICLRAHHILGRLNVVTDKLSRHRLVIQTEWLMHLEAFAQVCHRRQHPEIDLLATRYNSKLPWFVSPVHDTKALAVDSLRLSLENLDLYAIPPIPLLTSVVHKALNHQCQRLIIIALGWPNMPWFWDLVELSSQIVNQVNFHSPSVEQIADFLLHLFQDRKLQPSTIHGYRSDNAYKIGNSTVTISKNENLNRLLDSFHMDRPKGHRGVPSWDFSLVLHQLTKGPFEPLRKASLKHLTFKMVFLLALGSGKCRSLGQSKHLSSVGLVQGFFVPLS